jgi:hypothetical protein
MHYPGGSSNNLSQSDGDVAGWQSPLTQPLYRIIRDIG